MSAVGIGYGTNSDRAHAITRQVIGNGSIVARITAASVEAGVGIRDSMHRYSRRAKLVWSASGQTLRFRPRVTSNTTDTATSIAGLALPLWVKLESVEATDTITASYAADVAGAPGAWITIGAPTVIAMDATADYSLTADSGSDTVAAAATFDHLALTPVPVGPAVLAEDFGDGTQTGTYSYVSGTDTHTLQGQGSLDGSGMFWGQQFAGDFILTVLQLDATSGATDARSSIMIRDCMDNGAMAFVGRIPTGSYASFVWRTNPKGGTGGLNGITQKKTLAAFHPSRQSNHRPARARQQRHPRRMGATRPAAKRLHPAHRPSRPLLRQRGRRRAEHRDVHTIQRRAIEQSACCKSWHRPRQSYVANYYAASSSGSPPRALSSAPSPAARR